MIPPRGKERFANGPDRPGHDHMDERDRRNEHGPDALGLARLQPQEHDSDRDQHHDRGSRAGRQSAEQQDRDRRPPPAPGRAGEVDGDRHGYDEHRAERDRMLRGRVDPQPAEARELAAALELEKRGDGMEVVEDVVARALLDERRYGQRRSSRATRNLSRNSTSPRRLITLAVT